MEFTEYQDLAKCTSGAYGTGQTIQRQQWAIIGLIGEVGELANKFKKKHAHGHSITGLKLAEEIGDILWYCAELADSLDIDLGWIARDNIEKLKERYPRGFSQERSANRGG